MSAHKSYLGDSVYVNYDGFGIILTTNNGAEDSNTIVIEPDVYDELVAFVAFVARLKEEGLL